MSRAKLMTDAIDAFVVGCKADGIWDAIKACCILAGWDGLAGALTPIKGSAPTNVNFVAGDYNRKRGLAGDGSTKYLNTNRANNAEPQDSSHCAVHVITSSTGTGSYISSGVGSGVNQILQEPGYGLVLRNRSSATFPSLSSAVPSGFIGHSRAAAASFTYRFSGANTLFSASSETPNANSPFIYSVNGYGGYYSNGRLAFYSIGSAIDLALLDTRVSTLLTSIWRAVHPEFTLVTNADAMDWIGRVYDAGGSVSTSTANAVNTFCNAIDSAGIRSKFLRLNLFAGNDLTSALVPLYRSSAYGGAVVGGATDTNNNFVSGDYVETGASGGITSNSSGKRLLTGFKLGSLPSAATDNHIGAFSFSHAPTLANHWMIGSREPTGTIGFMRTTNTSSGTWTVNNGTAVSYTYGGQHPTALYLSSRRTATAHEIYENSTSRVLNTSTSSTAPYDGDMWVFDVNNQGSSAGGFIFRLGGYTFGLGMTSAQVASLAAAWSAFNASLSRT